MITIDNDMNERDVRSELEQFLHHTQYYLNELQKIKNDLNELHRQNQTVLYIESLGRLKNHLMTSLGHFFLSDVILKNVSFERHEFYEMMKRQYMFLFR